MNMIIKQILRQKDIPIEIEYEIIQFLPDTSGGVPRCPKQENLKKEMIRRLNIWHQGYWRPRSRVLWSQQWMYDKGKDFGEIGVDVPPPRLIKYKEWKKIEHRKMEKKNVLNI